MAYESIIRLRGCLVSHCRARTRNRRPVPRNITRYAVMKRFAFAISTSATGMTAATRHRHGERDISCHMACMAQPCLARCTESVNPMLVVPDARPSSNSQSLAEPKRYTKTSVVILKRVFGRARLIGPASACKRKRVYASRTPSVACD